VTIDAAGPGAPSRPDLIAASDSGTSSTDNLTNDKTPTFTGTAEAGSTVTIYSHGVAIGSGVTVGGVYTVATSALRDGAHSITANATDIAGNISTVSAALSVTIDTEATIAINAISVDDTINSAERGNSLIISGTSSGLENALSITITLNGHIYAGTVSSGTWSVTTPADGVSGLSDGNYDVYASVSDLAGNLAVIDRGVLVDTTAPAFWSITTSGAEIDGGGNGDLNAGHLITLALNASEAVVVLGGSPTLTLNDGATAFYDAGHSTATMLAFDYTVHAGDNSPDVQVSSLNLNGAVIQDLAGNTANLTGANSVNPAGTLTVDTTAPTISIGTIAGDDVIDAQEAQSALILSGTTAGVETGQTITADLNNRVYTAIVQSDGSWSATAPQGDVATLIGGISYTLTVNVSDDAGNAALAASRIDIDEDFTLAATVPANDYTFGAYVSGGYAYVADNLGGLQILNVGDPTHPLAVGSYNQFVGAATNVTVSGNYAYVDDQIGLRILDVSNPSLPSLVGTYTNANGELGSTVIAGHYAFVTDFNNSAVHILDVSDPTHPTLVGTYTSSGNPHFGDNGAPVAVTVSGNYLYIADFSPAIDIVDVSNPANPTLVGTYSNINIPNPGSTSSPTALAVSGNYLYVADQDTGFYVLNVANPASPVLIGTYDPDHQGNHYTGVQIVGNFAYLSDASGKMVELDVSDPTHPEFVGSYTTGGSSNSITVAGEYAYLSDGQKRPRNHRQDADCRSKSLLDVVHRATRREQS
jgi:hypothetical protein